MKILYFYQYFSTPKGAWGTRAYEFARRWVDAGHKVTVVTSVYDKSDLKPEGLLTTLDVDGIEVKIINVKLSNKHNPLFRAWTFLIYAIIASWYALFLPADIVVASSGPITVGLPGLIARLLRRRPFVFEVRDLFSEGLEQMGLVNNRWTLKSIRFTESIFYRFSDVVVALSPSMAEWIVRDYNPKRVEVIPNAADNELFAKKLKVPEVFGSDKKAFVFTGTIGTANNCEQLIDAAVVLNERGISDVDIYLIGDGKEKADLQDKANQLGLQNIHFVSLMPKEELVAWLQHARASLLILQDIPVFETVSPNKFFDSLAAGLPVIQTTQGWIKDVIEENRCGFTVDSQKSDSLVNHIITLAQDEDVYEQMSMNAADLGKKYDRSLLSQQYIELLTEVTGHES